jgi:hypothetical protein
MQASQCSAVMWLSLWIETVIFESDLFNFKTISYIYQHILDEFLQYQISGYYIKITYYEFCASLIAVTEF